MQARSDSLSLETTSEAPQLTGQPGSELIVFVLDSFQIPMSREIAVGAMEASPGLEVVTTAVAVPMEPQAALAAVRALTQQQLRGLVLVASGLEHPSIRRPLIDALTDFEGRGGNVATLGLTELPYAGCDLHEEEAASTLARTLARRGYHRPLLFTASNSTASTTARARGFEHGFLASGIIIPHERHLAAPLDQDAACAVLLELPPERLTDCDLIACVDDSLALGALQAFRRRGIRAGEQIGISGFGDLLEATDVTPRLTSARMPARMSARRAIEFVLTRSRERAEYPIAVNLRDSTPLRHPEAGGVAAELIGQAAIPASPARMSDVARLAGVSNATVSRVINGHPRVNSEMAKRVLEAVEALNYEVGRAVTSGSRTVTLVLPNLDSDATRQLHEGFQEAAHNDGYKVILVEAALDLDEQSPAQAGVQLWSQVHVEMRNATVATGTPQPQSRFTGW